MMRNKCSTIGIDTTTKKTRTSGLCQLQDLKESRHRQRYLSGNILFQWETNSNCNRGQRINCTAHRA